MKRKIINTLLVMLVGANLIGCAGNEGSTSDANTKETAETNKENSQEDNKEDNKEDNSGDDAKDNSNEDDDNFVSEPVTEKEYEFQEEYETISDMNKYVYSNIIYAIMSSGDWETNPSATIRPKDFKKYFDEINEDNCFYQYILSVGIADYDSNEVYVSDSGVKYYYMCGAYEYSEFLKGMYGVREDFYKELTVDDISISALIYDEETDAIYYKPYMVCDMSCHYEGGYTDDEYGSNYVFSVSDEYDDGTPLNGQITITVAITECIGWNIFFEGATFEKR